MRALYEARVGDLSAGDFVRVLCRECGHTELLPHSTFQHGLRLPPHIVILDLARLFRCRECDEKGRVHISIRWADPAPINPLFRRD
jgi:hypothetical protein